MADGFTPEQLQQIDSVVRQAVRDEIADAGLRIDGPDHIDEAREDFRWLRRIRKSFEGGAAKVGMAVILSITGGILYLVVQGFKLFGAK